MGIVRGRSNGGVHPWTALYCAEPIKDSAIVCSHCGRDLVFFKPLMTRIDGLEKRVSTLEHNLERRLRALPESEPALPSSIPLRLPILAVLFTTCIAVVAYAASLPEATSSPLLLTSIFCPFPISLLLGFVSTSRVRFQQGLEGTLQMGMLSFVVFGLCSGLLTFGALSVILFMGGEKVITSDFWIAAAIYIAGGGVLFGAGGFIGRWLRKKGEYGPSDWPVRIASRLVPSRNSSQAGEKDRDEKIRRVAALVNALAPILTLLGTLVTAYLAYLGKLNAAP